MSLKQKIKCWICNNNPPKTECLSSCIETKDYLEAIESFKDARDHPEKHPELVRKFGKELMNEDNFKEISFLEIIDLYYLNINPEWSIWLFSEVFEK